MIVFFLVLRQGYHVRYLFYLAEGMQKGAEELGLPADLAERLVHQTLFGAAKLLRESPEKAAELRQRVTSPGGTTAAAIAVFDEKGVNRAVVDALSAASRRGVELGATQD